MFPIAIYVYVYTNLWLVTDNAIPPHPPALRVLCVCVCVCVAGLAPSCCSTPPPTFDEVLEQRAASTTMSVGPGPGTGTTPSRSRVSSHVTHHVSVVKSYREDAVRYIHVHDICYKLAAEFNNNIYLHTHVPVYNM